MRVYPVTQPDDPIAAAFSPVDQATHGSDAVIRDQERHAATRGRLAGRRRNAHVGPLPLRPVEQGQTFGVVVEQHVVGRSVDAHVTSTQPR